MRHILGLLVAMFALVAWYSQAPADGPAKEPVFAFFLAHAPGSVRGAMVLARTDLDGKNRVNLTNFDTMNVRQFSVSPDGKQIICHRSDSKEPTIKDTITEDIIIVTPQGKITQTIPVPNKGIAMTFGPPSLLADQKHVGFTAALSIPSNAIGGATVATILTLDIEGKKLTALAHLPVGQDDKGPAFGKNLNAKEVLAEGCDQASWSPDGKTILCTFGKHAIDGEKARWSQRLWALDADGSNPRPIAADETCYGTFSPDGKSIVFLQLVGNTSELFIADAEGKNPRQVTKLKSILASPRWLADGKTLEFFKANNPSQGYAGTIWTIHADGTNATQITFNPDWESIDGSSETRLIQTLQDRAPVAP